MYAKVFSSLWNGSMVGKADPQLVFVFLLAHCDRAGYADIHPEVITALTGIPGDRVRAALDVLEAPDPASRSPEQDGRRIVRRDQHRDWGWDVVNYEHYRGLMTEDMRREADRDRQKRYRDRHATVTPMSQPSRYAEAEAEVLCRIPAESSCPEPAAPASGPVLELTPDEPAKPDPVVETLPTNRDKSWNVTESAVKEWSRLYPAVDVVQEVRKMRGWLMSKPAHRKTSRGMAAFVTNWLSRAQDKAVPVVKGQGTRSEGDSKWLNDNFGRES